jgi:hypothetical protein
MPPYLDSVFPSTSNIGGPISNDAEAIAKLGLPRTLHSGRVSFSQIYMPWQIQLDESLPYSRKFAFPLALGVSRDVNFDQIIQAVPSNISREDIQKTLDANGGAVFFSGLPIQTAEQFSRFTAAFRFTPHEAIGRIVRRTHVAEHVAMANEYDVP